MKYLMCLLCVVLSLPVIAVNNNSFNRNSMQPIGDFMIGREFRPGTGLVDDRMLIDYIDPETGDYTDPKSISVKIQNPEQVLVITVAANKDGSHGFVMDQDVSDPRREFYKLLKFMQANHLSIFRYSIELKKVNALAYPRDHSLQKYSQFVLGPMTSRQLSSRLKPLKKLFDHVRSMDGSVVEGFEVGSLAGIKGQVLVQDMSKLMKFVETSSDELWRDLSGLQSLSQFEELKNTYCNLMMSSRLASIIDVSSGYYSSGLKSHHLLMKLTVHLFRTHDSRLNGIVRWFQEISYLNEFCSTVWEEESPFGESIIAPLVRKIKDYPMWEYPIPDCYLGPVSFKEAEIIGRRDGYLHEEAEEVMDFPRRNINHPSPGVIVAAGAVVGTVALLYNYLIR